MRTLVAFLAVVATTGVAATGGGPRAPQDPGRAAGMRDHYTDALKLHAAVIAGEPSGVNRAAAALATYDAPLGSASGAAVFVDVIRRQAGLAGSARDTVGAAYATATLLAACGDCHRLSGVMPAAQLAQRATVGTVVGHMLAHQRAADQMLQGLVVPSTSLWTEGVKGFITAPLRAGDLGGDSARQRRMLDTEQRIHRIAGDAAQATDAKARAGFYAQMLAGCADCHKPSR